MNKVFILGAITTNTELGITAIIQVRLWNKTCKKELKYMLSKILKSCNYEDVWEKTRCYTIPEIKNLPSEFAGLTYTELAEYVKDCIREDLE